MALATAPGLEVSDIEKRTFTGPCAAGVTLNHGSLVPGDNTLWTSAVVALDRMTPIADAVTDAEPLGSVGAKKVRATTRSRLLQFRNNGQERSRNRE